MLPTRHLHMQWELVKWVTILTLACALAATLASRVAGGAEPRIAPIPPAILPLGVADWSKPMPPQTSTDPADVPHDDPQLRLWRLLDLQHRGLVEDAIAEWQALPLPQSTEVWRYVALAQAHLSAGQLREASAALDTGRLFDAKHPALHYYLALLRLEQARHAREWFDAVDTGLRLVAYIPEDESTTTKSMYLLAAKQELEQAIATAPQLVLSQPLIPATQLDPFIRTASVGDVLEALGADRMAARSHNMLSYLCLDEGALEQAESHLDAAAAGGMTIVYGYRDLADRYAASDRHLDAARAGFKALRHGAPATPTLIRIWYDASKALADL